MAHPLEVFLTFLRIGMVSFGGGMANLPEMSRILIGKGWVTPQGFADGFALGQFVPGPNMLAVLFYGWSAAGWVGTLAAALGMFLPGAIGAMLLVRGWQWMSKAQWSRALRKALVPISMGLAGSMLVVLVQLSLESALWVLITAVATYLIHRGTNLLAVIAGGGAVGLLLTIIG
jgi:chromate transporter